MANPQFSDVFDWSGPLTDGDWDVETNGTDVPNVASNLLYLPDSAPADDYNEYACIYQDACDGVEQAAKFKFGTIDENEGTIGVILRGAAADGTGAQYALACLYSGGWGFASLSYTGRAYQSRIGSDVSMDKPADGNWVGFSVSGTGNDTVFKFWEWPSDPGNYENWGTDNGGSGNQYLTQEGNPADARDTGAYTGIWHYHSDSDTDIKTISEWAGGDQEATGGSSTPSSTPTHSSTPSSTPTRSNTPSSTLSSTPTHSNTLSSTPTHSSTPSSTLSTTPTHSNTLSSTPTHSSTPSSTLSSTPTHSNTLSTTPTHSSTVSSTLSSTPTHSNTLSTTPTHSSTPSSTVSSTPSSGWQGYTKGQYGALPANANDLSSDYSEQNYTDVESNNAVRVGQSADDSNFAIHEFKDFIDESYVTVVADLQSDYAPSSSTVYLQIYNYDTTTWETKDSEGAADADTDFELTAAIADLTDYTDSGIMTWRIYQENNA